MVDLLLPYGCERNADLVAKAGGLGKTGPLLPYGEESNAELAAKTGPGKAVSAPPSSLGSSFRSRRVVRLNRKV